MEDEDILDSLNDMHFSALHYVYLPQINSKVEWWGQAWSTHRLQTVNSFPMRLWVSGQINNHIDVSPHEVEDYYGIDSNVSGDERDDNGRPIFDMWSLHLSQNCLDQPLEPITEVDVQEDIGQIVSYEPVA